MEACKAVEALANGLRREMSAGGARALLPLLAQRLKERNAGVVRHAHSALDALLHALDLDAVWEEVQKLCTDMKDKAARQQALTAITRWLRSGKTLAKDPPVRATAPARLDAAAAKPKADAAAKAKDG